MIQPLSVFCQGQDLTPKLIGEDYCFDSLQIRYVAKVVYQAPIKDSINTEQKTEIENLNKQIDNKNTIIEVQETVIENDSLIINKLEQSIVNEKDLGNLKVSQEKHKSKKIKLVAIGEGLVILLFLILR